MKKHLLLAHGQWYKANLHCHTTLSDASWTPEEVKANYMAQGYSIVAYTDHRFLFPQNHLAEPGFLPLNGVEHDVNEDGPKTPSIKTCHFCCIALEPDNVLTPCWESGRYIGGNEKNLHLAQPEPESKDFRRHYDPDSMNALMAEVKKQGFFITYNHPDWSLEEQEIFCQYTQMDAMEIVNYGCITGGFEDYNPKAYDALLRRGRRIFCVADDDNHNRNGTEDAFGGWTMIKADALEYRTITKALQEGNFYASMGPEIYDLWVEDGVVHITCSDAREVFFTTNQRHRQRSLAEEGKSLTEASFKLLPSDLYFRVTVVDHQGKPADTNAYFLDELGESCL